MLSSRNPHNWAKNIDSVLKAMRYTKCKATGFSPLKVVYNKTLRLTFNTKYDIELESKYNEINLKEQAKINIYNYIDKYKINYDKNSSD